MKKIINFEFELSVEWIYAGKVQEKKPYPRLLGFILRWDDFPDK